MVSSPVLAEPSTRIHFMLVIPRALMHLGGAAAPAQVYSWIEEHGLRRSMVAPRGINPDRHYEREVRFARQELADGGLVHTLEGRWALTRTGRETLTPEAARRLIGENRRRRQERRADGPGRQWSNSAETLAREVVSSKTRSGAPTTGPRPSAWTAVSTRHDGPASTYVFKFEGADLWKIGFAADVSSRLAAVNQHIPIELLDRRWQRHLVADWPSQELAYAMEQEVLRRLVSSRTMFERVSCASNVLTAAWEQSKIAVEQRS